jgi:Domain of unknown function (DUF4276)
VHIEFLVEEFSAQEFLQAILPKILDNAIDYEIRSFRGKTDLLKKLPDRLKGYRPWIPEDFRIVVMIDRDDEPCHDLKNKLDTIALDAGFIPKSTAEFNQSYQILNRIAIEELEAWFFGDIEAVSLAYPGIPSSLGEQRKYRDPDAIAGGTWENLEKVLQKAGHHKGGLEKVRAAREISQYMNPAVNRSKSFRVFYAGLLEIIVN